MSNLELNNYGVVISAYELPADQNEQRYYDSVKTTLDRIGVTLTGNAIYSKIIAHGQVLIVPYTEDYVRRFGACNSEAENIDTNKSHRVAKIAFTPAKWGVSSTCGRRTGFVADNVLLHELVHAGRKLGGDDVGKVPLAGRMAGYDDEEEFFAILVENIYISETGREISIGLRSDHTSTNKMDRIDNEEFLSDPENFRLVEKYCDQHPNIAPKLAFVSSEFNPIRQYYAWGKKVPDYPILRINPDVP